ncbi:MAG: ribokinase [Desulfobacterales bacterium]|nr:MAG: ribokinase [Desulfobacterales bacterium]
MERPKVCVVGACNLDLISYVPRLPKMGETLHGLRFHMGFGGKGANQAVMAAKLGGQVTMVTKLGQDVFGENTLKNFASWGVDTQHVHFTDQAFSGVAPIAVDPDGHNAIIIVTGANDLLTPEEIEAARPAIAAARILVCQLEIPLEINLAALRLAREAGVQTIFNPAPARPALPAEFYQLSDIFCPNESETELLTGRTIQTLEEAEAAARVLIERGAGTVILTLGERGSLLVTDRRTEHVPVEPVQALDTTGAGDAFVGSLAYFLAAGQPLSEAIRCANSIAAISVQSSGTQTSFPAAKDLPPELLAGLGGLQREGAAAQAPDSARITAAEMAQYIDHTLLKPEAPASAFDRLCEEALRYGFKAVCVNSSRVAQVAEKLQGTRIAVCAVIGFPLGAMARQAKAFEARQAVADGAQELDMVINLGALKSGDFQAVEEDIRAVRRAAPHPTLLKVIIETALLTAAEKVRACEIAQKAGADFVKTSTGFATGGATVADVILMRKTVGPEMGVKASGGIKDFATAWAMIEAGASRIGAGAGVAIVTDAPA